MKLYLPCSSKNFSLIFESESISPKAFYSKRNFGNIRFILNPLDLSENYLTLYSKPILFETSEKENYPMWLELDIEMVSTSLTDANRYNSGIPLNYVYLFPKTLYFDNHSFRCIFSNPKHLKDTKINSESYRTVKAVSKYKIEIEELSFFTPHIEFEKIDVPTNEFLEYEIEKDKRFNHLKGLIYGYAIGILNESTPQKNEVFKILNELQNTFTNAKSLSIMVNANDRKKEVENYWGKNKPLNNRLSEPVSYDYNRSREDLLNLINKLEVITPNLFKDKTTEDDNIILKAKEVLDLLIHEDSPAFLIEQSRNLIKSISLRKDHFRLIKKAVHDFSKTIRLGPGIGSSESEISERLFKTSLKKIERQAEQKFLINNSRSEVLDLDLIEIVSSTKISVKRDKINFNEEKEYLILELIISQLLRFPRHSKLGEVSRDEKTKIIKSIGLSPSFQNLIEQKVKSEPYYRELGYLYEHYSKFSNLIYEKINSNILLNFACFLNKIDNFQELIEFTSGKEVKNRGVAYLFWGCYNGFTEIGNKESKVIFSSHDLKLTNSFDTYLKNVLIKLEREIFENEVLLDKHIVNDDSSVFSDEKVAYGKVQTNESNTLLGTDKHLTMTNILSDLNSTIDNKLNSLQWETNQKIDILTAFKNTRASVLEYTNKGVDIFSEKRHILDHLKKSIKEVNRKRKKAEYKISSEKLEQFISELTQS